MKRYLLFFGLTYYPGGGMEDFEGDFDSVTDATKKLKDFFKEEQTLCWGMIYDTNIKKLIFDECIGG